MRKQSQDFQLKHYNELRSLRSGIFKFIKSVSYGYEETQRKLKYNEELAGEVAATEAIITSIATEESRLAEERENIEKKNVELNGKLKRETSRVEDLQLAINKERTSKCVYFMFLNKKFSNLWYLKELKNRKRLQKILMTESTLS